MSTAAKIDNLWLLTFNELRTNGLLRINFWKPFKLQLEAKSLSADETAQRVKAVRFVEMKYRE